MYSRRIKTVVLYFFFPPSFLPVPLHVCVSKGESGVKGSGIDRRGNLYPGTRTDSPFRVLRAAGQSDLYNWS